MKAQYPVPRSVGKLPAPSIADAGPVADREAVASLVALIADEFARAIATRLIEHLRANDFPGYVDQSTSPLGRRRHIAAVRSGRLPGVRVGRRYLARREDVDRFVSGSSEPSPASGGEDSVDDLAREIGLVRR